MTIDEAMEEARLAREAGEAGEVPVGRGRDAREAAWDPTAHAELLASRMPRARSVAGGSAAGSLQE